jgi:vacuolar-type H+-ATPase subunit F/Vma7
MKLKVLAEESIVNLFKLIGIDGKTPKDKGETIRIIREFVKERCVILISYKFKKELGDEALELSKELPNLILLEIPDLKGEMPDIMETQRLLEEAIGIKFAR